MSITAIVAVVEGGAITWTCQSCGDLAQYLWSPLSGYRAWHEQDQADRQQMVETGMITYDSTNWPVYDFDWRIHCDSCAVPAIHRDGEFYGFDLDRCRDIRAFLLWTAHLLTRDWIQGTNWNALARHISGYPWLGV